MIQNKSNAILKSHKCKTCENEFTGNYCNICGQKPVEGRFKFKKFIN